MQRFENMFYGVRYFILWNQTVHVPSRNFKNAQMGHVETPQTPQL